LVLELAVCTISDKGLTAPSTVFVTSLVDQYAGKNKKGKKVS
jgi:hypothetical protein